MENKDKFSYTYSAPTEAERREIESIKRQYKSEPETQSGIERLRSLHSKVVGTAMAVSLAIGIIGTLVFGFGLALVLELGAPVIGIIFATVGVLPIVAAFPMYNHILKKGKMRYGDEIIRLSDEILGE